MTPSFVKKTSREESRDPFAQRNGGGGGHVQVSSEVRAWDIVGLLEIVECYWG